MAAGSLVNTPVETLATAWQVRGRAPRVDGRIVWQDPRVPSLTRPP